MSLRISRDFNLTQALQSMGKDPEKLTRQGDALRRVRSMPRHLQHSQRRGRKLRGPFFLLGIDDVKGSAPGVRNPGPTATPPGKPED